MKELELIQSLMPPSSITRDDVDGVNIKYVQDTNDQFAVSRYGAVYSFTNKMRGKKIGSCVPSGYVNVGLGSST